MDPGFFHLPLKNIKLQILYTNSSAKGAVIRPPHWEHIAPRATRRPRICDGNVCLQESPGDPDMVGMESTGNGCFQKQGYPKMDGENNGKPYENSWFGGTIIFGNTQMAGNGLIWVQAKHQFFALQDGRTRLLYRILQWGRRCLNLVSHWGWEVGLKFYRKMTHDDTDICLAILPSRELT